MMDVYCSHCCGVSCLSNTDELSVTLQIYDNVPTVLLQNDSNTSMITDHAFWWEIGFWVSKKHRNHIL